ncbi:protein LURP-one-related 15 [Selaginella moellendorffii]|uniref:protein LURP-one-related 15 n=1 Tax=Selaginella moellendorffii TaxID=88036 RepID=UPI000D1C38B3|nr:protein LURP-one-related 15 [Selaginella moellendorffii]|eukprot:XP_024535931.1 protein LURP-one-related 15 [Selaginella moellendorffii]
MAAVVGDQFRSAQEQLQLVYERNTWSSDTVTDLNGRLLLKVKRPTFSATDVLITDPSSRPIVVIYHELKNFRTNWKVFREQSRDTPLLCTVRKSSRIQFSLSLDVFLASNNPDSDSSEPDFQVKKEVLGSSIEVSRGRGGAVVARAEAISLLSNTRYQISVAPGIDYVFVLSLILIVKEKEEARQTAPSSNLR